MRNEIRETESSSQNETEKKNFSTTVNKYSKQTNKQITRKKKTPSQSDHSLTEHTVNGDVAESVQCVLVVIRRTIHRHRTPTTCLLPRLQHSRHEMTEHGKEETKWRKTHSIEK
jgi:hypothetical protein